MNHQGFYQFTIKQGNGIYGRFYAPKQVITVVSGKPKYGLEFTGFNVNGISVYLSDPNLGAYVWDIHYDGFSTKADLVFHELHALKYVEPPNGLTVGIHFFYSDPYGVYPNLDNDEDAPNTSTPCKQKNTDPNFCQCVNPKPKTVSMIMSNIVVCQACHLEIKEMKQ